MVRWQVAFVLGMVGAASAAACSSNSKGIHAAGGATGGTAAGGKGSGGKAGGGGKSGSGGSGGAAGSSSGGSGNRGGSGGKGSGGAAGEEPGTGGMGESGSSGNGGSAGRGGSAGTGGTTGMAGEAGAGGEGGEGPLSLQGYQVRFIGQAHAYSAYTEAELEALITGETGVAPDRVHTESPPELLTAEDLDGADIVISDVLQRTYSVAEASILADWVDAGHGVIIMNGYTGNPDNASAFGAIFQISFSGGIVNGAAAGERVAGSDLLAHPITNGVTSLRFYGGHQLTSDDAMATPFALVDATPVGLARSWGEGRVAVWGDDWILLTGELDYTDTDTSHPTQVFWRNALHWVARPK